MPVSPLQKILAASIIGYRNALSKQGLTTGFAHDPQPMKRAVAFCQVIEA